MEKEISGTIYSPEILEVRFNGEPTICGKKTRQVRQQVIVKGRAGTDVHHKAVKKAADVMAGAFFRRDASLPEEDENKDEGLVNSVWLIDVNGTPIYQVAEFNHTTDADRVMKING